jgi:hypothetical protein
VSVFWDEDGILIVDYLEKDATIISKYYFAHLDRSRNWSLNVEASFQKESCFFKTMLLLARQPLHTRNWQIVTLKF